MTTPSLKGHVQQKQLRNATLFFGCLFIASVILLCASFGCAGGKPVTPAQVNKTITSVIADAGTVAITAKQEYESGKLPQTDAVRYAINDLGNAYEQAKAVYIQVLQAQGTYNGSQFAQINSCGPGQQAGNATCQAATAAAETAKANLDTAQQKLSDSIDTLVTKTNAVKALQK